MGKKINEKELKKELKVLLNSVNAEKKLAKKRYLNYDSNSMIKRLLPSKSELKEEKNKWQRISTNLRKSITPGPDRVAQRIKKKKSK